jgi:hypothetical protein
MDPKIQVDFDDDGEVDLELRTSQVIKWVAAGIATLIAWVTSLTM